jgi:hypothetical protein
MNEDRRDGMGRADYGWHDYELGPELRARRAQGCGCGCGQDRGHGDRVDELIASLDSLAELEAYGRSIGIPIAGVGHEPGQP